MDNGLFMFISHETKNINYIIEIQTQLNIIIIIIIL